MAAELAARHGQAARLDTAAAEAGLSRLYGGIHYRLDLDAGAVMGRAIGPVALAVGVR